MSESIQSVFEGQNTVEMAKEAKQLSYPFLVYENSDELSRLEEALAVLRQSKTGAKLIEEAERHKTTIAIDSGMRAYGSYDEVKNHVKLNAASDLDRRVGTMAHELRHAQQFQKGILLDAYLDNPKCYVQNQAVIEADASATATAVCYELALQGNDKPLESLREKDAHIVNPFQNEAVRAGLVDGAAYQAAFKGWFTDYSTRDSYDILHIKMINQRFRNCTREEEEKKFERIVPVNDVVQKVCACNGKSYLSEKEADAFFATEDACSVSFERFNNLYGNCCMKFNFDWSKSQDETMKEKLGLVSRPHYGYMPTKIVPEVLPIPTVEARQMQAALKIAEAKKDKVKNVEKGQDIAVSAAIRQKISRGK